MEQKIAMMNHDLRKYFPNKRIKYLKAINSLSKICKFRNKFAHCPIEWDRKQKDMSYFYILIISDIDKQEKPSLIKMTYTEFANNVEKMRKIVLEMMALTVEIEADFLHKYPNFFKSSHA